MAKRFVFVLAGIVAVMAALIVIPNVTQPQTQGITISYTRQQFITTDAGSAITKSEILNISKDGAATYSLTGSEGRTSEKPVPLTKEELARIRALIMETGFMQIPKTEYLQQDGDAEFTRYILQIDAEGEQKVVVWVDPDSYRGIIPPIISNVGTQLDALIVRA